MIITIALTVLCCLCFLGWMDIRKRKANEPPLVRHLIPYLGASLQFGKDPLNYLRKLQRKHGDVFTVRLLGWNVHFFTNPHDLRSIEAARDLDAQEILGDFVSRMVDDGHCIHKEPRTIRSKWCWPGQDLPVDGKRSSNSKERVSHILNNALRGNARLSTLASSCPSVVKDSVTALLNNKVQDGSPQKFQLYELCKEIMFHVTFGLFYGANLDEEKNRQEMKKIYEQFSIYFDNISLVAQRVPIFFLPKVKASREKLLQLLAEVDWTQRVGVSDLVNDLVNAKDAAGQTNARVRHLLMILWTAQANTLPTLFWTIFYALKNDDARREILEEFEAICTDKDGRDPNNNVIDEKDEKNSSRTNMINRLSKTDLDQTIVLDSFIKEVLRLTSSSLNLRKASKDLEVKTASGTTFTLRKGDYTSYYSACTHMDSDIFHDPTNFVYDRFLARNTGDMKNNCDDSSSSGEESNHHRGARVLPKFYKSGRVISRSKAIMNFGFGEYKCPGRHIAMIEVKLILLYLLRFYDVKLDHDRDAPSYDLTHLGFGVLPPNSDVEVTIGLR